MNDLISRRAAIKAIDDLPNCYNGYSDTYDKACIIGTLEEVPTIDAVPVVRCRECKNMYEDCGGTTCAYGAFVDCITPNDFYCAFGERSDE